MQRPCMIDGLPFAHTSLFLSPTMQIFRNISMKKYNARACKINHPLSRPFISSSHDINFRKQGVQEKDTDNAYANMISILSLFLPRYYFLRIHFIKREETFDLPLLQSFNNVHSIRYAKPHSQFKNPLSFSIYIHTRS